RSQICATSILCPDLTRSKNEYLKSAAVILEPSWKFTSSRRSRVKLRPSGARLQFFTSFGRILIGHALKNASLPTLTLAGVQFGILFSGTLLIEVIYSYPGMGNLMVDAVRNADLPLIQAIGLTYCVVVLIVNTTVDGLYVVLNPKLRVRCCRLQSPVR